MQKQPFFPLFLGDLLTSCDEWPGEAVALYTMLLARQWFSPEHSIPGSPELVRGLVRWDTATFDRFWPIVAKKFREVTVHGEPRLQNLRCEYHRERDNGIRQKRAQAANTRWAQSDAFGPQSDANASKTDADASGLHMPQPNPTQPFPSPPVSESPDGDSSPPGRGRKAPPCPYEQITAVYEQILPDYPKLVTHPQWRRAAVQARWREDARFQVLDFWKGFFRYAGESDFLSGRTRPMGDRKPFQADFDWLVGAKNFHKVLSGKYHHD